MNKVNSNSSRREALRRIGRYAAGGALAALTGALLWRNGDATATPACPNGAHCGRCGRAGTCALPPAEMLRKNAVREDDHA